MKIRKLLEKHAKEVAQLENELRKEEVSSINKVSQGLIKINYLLFKHLLLVRSFKVLRSLKILKSPN